MTEQERKLKELEKNVGDNIERFRVALGWDAPDTPAHPRHVFIGALRQGVTNHDPKSADYAHQIEERLFLPEAEEDMTHVDRQRCLITILATRPERFPLALHVLFGLLEGVRVPELRHIFFLVGTYTGIPGMIAAIDLSIDLFRVLEAEIPPRIAPAEAPGLLKTIFAKVFEDFSPLAPALQLVRALSTTTHLDEAAVTKALANLPGYLNAAGLRTALAMSERSGSSKTN